LPFKGILLLIYGTEGVGSRRNKGFLRIDEKGRNEDRGGGGHVFVVLCIAGDILIAMNYQSYET
jgi:hypothetical protein